MNYEIKEYKNEKGLFKLVIIKLFIEDSRGITEKSFSFHRPINETYIQTLEILLINKLVQY